MREIGQAQWIGTTARELIARRDCVGRVLAVVKGAVYLEVVIARSEATKQSPSYDSGIASLRDPSTTPLRGSAQDALLAMTEEVIWLAQNHVPMHTRVIRGDFDFGALNVGMAFESDETCLRFNHQATLRFADAGVWQPTRIDPTSVAPREVVVARVHKLDPKGFTKPFGSLRELVGLGEGLTPSGDDFIGGVLFAQWHLHKVYSDALMWDHRAVDDLIEYARTRTNVISYAILRDHARGQSVEPMHNLITALLHGESIDVIMPHVQNLITIGNTSGREMLGGLIMGAVSTD